MVEFTYMIVFKDEEFVLMIYLIYLDTPLLQQEEAQEEEAQEEETIFGIPVCALNLSTPVTDRANYTQEIHYRIGNRMYIENAD